MRRARRVSIALLLVASLAAAHGGDGLARSVVDSGDGSTCCCPSPEECHCTANCCSHGPAHAAEAGRDEAATPELLASLSCHFPRLPDGSLAGTASHEGAKGVPTRAGRELSPPDPSTRRPDGELRFEPADGSSHSSSRAPPACLRVRC